MKATDSGYAPVPGHLTAQVRDRPELHAAEVPELSITEYEPLLDSANARPADWLRVARDLASHRSHYDGFVVLHGTDTMAYTASALAFLLRGLGKPVVVTGSQIPLGVLRSDGRQNLLTVGAGRRARRRARGLPGVRLAHPARLPGGEVERVRASRRSARRTCRRWAWRAWRSRSTSRGCARPTRSRWGCRCPWTRRSAMLRVYPGMPAVGAARGDGRRRSADWCWRPTARERSRATTGVAGGPARGRRAGRRGRGRVAVR